jgi:hypothetical protein
VGIREEGSLTMDEPCTLKINDSVETVSICLACHWSNAEYILSVQHAIGRMHVINWAPTDVEGMTGQLKREVQPIGDHTWCMLLLSLCKWPHVEHTHGLSSELR